VQVTSMAERRVLGAIFENATALTQA
jgi:hypothetical protein